jgi:tetratricopeptide (TPR) repeat protein
MTITANDQTLADAPPLPGRGQSRSTPSAETPERSEKKKGSLKFFVTNDLLFLIKTLVNDARAKGTRASEKKIFERAIDKAYETLSVNSDALSGYCLEAREHFNGRTLPKPKVPELSKAHIDRLAELSAKDCNVNRQDVLRLGLFLLQKEKGAHFQENISLQKREGLLRFLEHPLCASLSPNPPFGIKAPTLSEIPPDMPLLIDAWIVIGAIVGRREIGRSILAPFSWSANDLLRARASGSARTMISALEILRVIDFLRHLSAVDAVHPASNKCKGSDLHRVYESLKFSSFLEIQDITKLQLEEAAVNWIRLSENKGESGCPSEMEQLLRVACAKVALPSGYAIATCDSSFDCLRERVPIYKATDLGKCSLDNRPSKELPIALRQHDEAVARADKHKRAGRWDEAIKCLQRALELNPDDAESHNKLGFLFSIQSRLNEAIVCFKKALALKHNYVDFYTNLGRFFHVHGRFNAAIACYRKALSLKPNDAALYNRLGVVFASRGRKGEAIECYQKAVKLKANFSAVYYNLGTSFEDQGKAEEAIPYFQKALEIKPTDPASYKRLGAIFARQGKSAEAITSFQQAVKLRPGYAMGHNDLGVLFEAQGQLDKAIASFKRALKLHPEVLYYKNLGHAVAALGQLDEALTCYKKAVELRFYQNGNFIRRSGLLFRNRDLLARLQQALEVNRDLAEVYNGLGMAFATEGKSDEAMGWFSYALTHEQALTRETDYVEVHYSLGVICKDMGRFDEAIGCFRQALALNPDYAEVHYNVGIALENLGRNDEAMASYVHALTLKPGGFTAYDNLETSIEDESKLNEAIGCLLQILETRPDCANIHYYLGNIFKIQRCLDQALSAYQRALQLKPDFAEALCNVGIILNKQNRWDDAVEYFEKALKLNPAFAEAHYNLGISLQAQGYLDKVPRCFQQALNLAPNSRTIRSKRRFFSSDHWQLNIAIACFQHALALKRNYGEVHSNLGNALMARGRSDEAKACFQKAREAFAAQGQSDKATACHQQALNCCRTGIAG